MKDDDRAAEIFAQAGAKVHDMNEAQFEQWRKVAQESAFKDFEERVKNGKQWLEMALAVK